MSYRTALVVIVAVIGCRRGIEPRSSSQRPAPINTSVERFITANAPVGATDCGIGDGVQTDARVYDCGSAAIRAKRSFFCRYIPPVASGPMQPWQVTVGYIYDSATTSLSLVTMSQTGRVSRQDVIREGVLPPRWYLDRGMRVPVPLRIHTAVSPAPKIEGIVIVNCTIDAAGHVRNCRIDKDLPAGVGTAALRLVEAASFRPAQLFGIAVPILFNVTVRSRNGTLVLDRPPL